MSTSKILRNRKDVDNSDIPDIIERAERIRQQHVSELEREKNRSSIHDVKLVGRDLSIPDEFVEQAIVELRQERLDKIQDEKEEREEREAQHTAIRTGASKAFRFVGVLLAGILLLRTVQWLWVVLDFTPQEEAAVEPKVVVEERIIKETVLKTVKTVIEEPVVAETPPSIEEPKTEEVREEDVIINEPPEPTVETVQKDQPVVEEDLSTLSQAIEGEWVLDAYLLYEKGVTLPMEVPIVYEPLQLPKTWRFTNRKYKRVMDSDLSFTARFEVQTLPDTLRPVVDDQGEWGQLVASNVVSSIPGIRRQNDYFAILVGRDTLTIWYLGPNAYRKKIPSQAERYMRK